MKTPRQGPTPVGSRNRAATIPSKRNPGPSADEWDYELEPLDYRCPLTGQDLRS